MLKFFHNEKYFDVFFNWIITDELQMAVRFRESIEVEKRLHGQFSASLGDLGIKGVVS